MEKWVCAVCGEEHEGVPTSYGFDAPWTWYTVPAEERGQRCFLDSDYCRVDASAFFVRGVLEIPIIGREEPFSWGVWVSLSEANYERERMLAEKPERVNEPVYFGWLMSRILIYPDTWALKTGVHTRAVGLRPLIRLQPTDHPLAVEQRNGIIWDRVIEIAQLMRHGWVHPDWNVRD